MPDNIIESIISDIQNKNYSAAIKRLDELIDKNPSNHDLYEIKAGCNYALGNYEYAVDDWTYAIINFKNAVDHKKELSVIYGKRGKTYLKLRNYFNASEDFGKSLKLFPESAETLNNLATCMRRLKNYDEALKFADDAVTINPDFSDAFNNRANINYCLGNIENALKDYSSAIERDPGNAKAFFNRGSLYYHLSDEDNARKDWEKAISLDEDIKQELQKLHPEFSMVKQEPDAIPGEVITPAESETTEFKIESVEFAGNIIPGIQEEIPSEQENVPLETELKSYEPEIKSDVPESEPEILSESEPEILSESEPEILPESEPEEVQEVVPEIIPEIKPEAPETEPAETGIKIEGQGFKPEVPEIKTEAPEEKTEEFTFESFLDVFEKKETEFTQSPEEKPGSIPDFEIPDLDFKSIFMDSQAEETAEEQSEEPAAFRPLISEEVQKLHEEIEKPESDDLKGFKGFTMDVDSVTGTEKEAIQHTVYEDEERKTRKSLEFITSPVFLVILILGILLVAVIALYQIIGIDRQESGTVVTKTTDSATVKSGQTADSISGKTDDTANVTEEDETPADKETAEEVKESEPGETAPPVKETVQQESVSRNLGFISDKKKFILVSENDGFYVQVGSYKDKSKAEEIVKGLSGKGIKASVIEVDLKEKGIYFRVRAGAFTGSDEAKQKMSGLE